MLDQYTVVNKRPDRELQKKVITPGDYNLVPYESSRCKIILSDVEKLESSNKEEVFNESLVFNPSFDGNILIGDTGSFLDRDFELILQQMCQGEVSLIKMTYKDNNDVVRLDISCKVELKELSEEQLISDWSWQRLFEEATYQKDKGVELVKKGRLCDAFKRFSKGLKLMVAIEPVDTEVVPEESLKDLLEIKVKLYNNLAHCQLQYKCYDEVIELCNKSLAYDPDNIKALYRRCVARIGLNLIEEAWGDIQRVLQLDPSDKQAIAKAAFLKPKMDVINKKYANVVKKMFS